MEEEIDYRKLWRYVMDERNFDYADELKQSFLHFEPFTHRNTIVAWFLEKSGLTFEALMAPINAEQYNGFEVVEWDQLKVGDTGIYINNYMWGRQYRAAPRFSGPYIVIDPAKHILETTWKIRRLGTPKSDKGTFRQFETQQRETLLRKVKHG